MNKQSVDLKRADPLSLLGNLEIFFFLSQAFQNILLLENWNLDIEITRLPESDSMELQPSQKLIFPIRISFWLLCNRKFSP